MKWYKVKFSITGTVTVDSIAETEAEARRLAEIALTNGNVDFGHIEDEDWDAGTIISEEDA